MTLAGTRPPTVDEWDKYELHHRARLATKPGLTGMWQVSGRSNITDFEEVVKLDKQYISEWTMGLDQRAKWGKLASTYIMMGEKCAVKYADEIIVLSKGVQDYFKETYGRETKFIPNGVNRPVIRKPELIKEKFGLEKDDYILFLGRLVPEKGIAYLIEAFKKVNTDKKLVIAGGSSDTDEFASQLKEMAKDDGRIIFTGFVQGQLLDELYSNAYIYSLPSDLEGMPLSLLEAMSYTTASTLLRQRTSSMTVRWLQRILRIWLTNCSAATARRNGSVHTLITV